MSYNSELQSNNTDLQSILDTINALPDREEGGIELPTLENPGTANDLLQDKELIDADGNVVTGTLVNIGAVNRTLDTNTKSFTIPAGYHSGYGRVSITMESRSVTPTKSENVVEPTSGRVISSVTVRAIPDNYIDTSDANATASEILKNKTAYVDGVLVTGTHECEEGFELPALTNPGTAADLVHNKQLIAQDGSVVTGTIGAINANYSTSVTGDLAYRPTSQQIQSGYTFESDTIYRKDSSIHVLTNTSEYGNATAADVANGKTFTSAAGLLVTGEALIPGGGFVYPDGAFAPVTSFTDGKQYALVAMVDGVRRYINTTDYNQYTMNATEITIGEDTGDYVIFSATPALFTAVASGNGFLLKNGNNYLYGTSSGGTALRVDTTQAVWTVDTSDTGGFSSGKYNPKEDANAVWLINNTGGYNWSIKYETAGGFGYDREGRDNTWSTGFTPFVLYEYVAGEGEVSPVVDTSDATATASDMAEGTTAYVNGKRIEGNVSRVSDYGFPHTSLGQGSGNGRNFYAFGTYAESDVMIKAGAWVRAEVEKADLGDATAADVANGKTFTSANGVKISGTASAGSTIKTGTTTSATIATGLSSIEEFFIYKESVSATGLIHLHYSKTGGTSYLYASAWSTSTMGTKTITKGTTAATVSGGSITLPSNTATSGGLTSGVTYKWVAVGKE